MTLPLRITIFTGLVACAAVVGRGDDPPQGPGTESTPADEEQIRRWVDELDADLFSSRRLATERLILAGAVSVDAVARAVEEGSLETVTRGIYILRELTLASGNLDTEAAAYQALQRIASRKVTAAARRAAVTLKTLDEARQLRARRYLESLGAEITTSPVQVGDRISRLFPTIKLGENWTGGDDDLRQLRWVTHLRPTVMNGAQVVDKWCLALQGQQVSDRWMETVQMLENIGAVQLKRTRVTDAGIARLTALKDLQFLEMYYNAVTDRGLEHLSGLRQASRIKLYDEKLSDEAVRQLQDKLGQVKVDFRRGGFLGIGCVDNPTVCQVSQVQPDSAAQRAGIETGDVITRYAENPVKNFEELTAQIAKHAPGESVAIDLLRDGRPIQIQVTLGEWE